MAYTTIDDPSAYFHIQLYTGNETNSTSITNNANAGDLKPDWLWIKNRTSGGGAGPQFFVDSSRGANKDLHAQADEAEHTTTNAVKSLNSDGFTIDSGGVVNENNSNFVAWQWKCNGGTSSASGSESGSNLAYDFQVNTTSKFMINKYTGRGSSSTLNLGNHFTPEFMIFKNRSQSNDWVVYHHKNTAYPHTDHLHLNTTAATSDDEQMFEDVVFAADEINLGTNHEVNADGENYVAYAFASVKGYSKFGSYTGTGSENGPFVYTGFKPRWIMIKNTGAAEEWVLQDTTRNPNNPITKNIRVDSNIAEADAANIDFDFLSNGFKNNSNQAQVNSSGVSYIYMAFAEHPFVSSKGVPTTAR